MLRPHKERYLIRAGYVMLELNIYYVRVERVKEKRGNWIDVKICLN